MRKRITVIGGDSRQIYAAGYLVKKGYYVTVTGFEHYEEKTDLRHTECINEAVRSDVILLPLPCSKNGKTVFTPFSSREILIKDLAEKALPKTLFLTGNASEQIINTLSANGHKAIDYFDREELTTENALLTAEGILKIILDKLPVTVFGLKAAITGYGRVAFYTAGILKSLGAEVTVFARSPVQLTKAKTAAVKTAQIYDFCKEERSFDCLINTVPHTVIGEKELSVLNKNCLLIETASAPYGIDKDIATEKNFTLIKAASLPGKTAPASAGKIIADTVDKIIGEV